ncbi:hypothetical protein WJX84_011953 [Apatococcus fuscideae]|uniref:Ion transport domain-containing protein n=1 Tax=Apatococcus fuscideae TaxID=2026836 RepID=A0AAW1RIF2_9CHLO
MGKKEEEAPSHHRINIQEVIGASGNEDPSAKGHSSLDAPSMPVCNHEAAPATHYGSLAHAGLPQDFFEHHSRLPSSYLVREMVVNEKGWQRFARGRLTKKERHQGVAADSRLRHHHSNNASEHSLHEAHVNQSFFKHQYGHDSGHENKEVGLVPGRRGHRFVTINPFSKLARTWFMAMLIGDGTYTAFIVPIFLAFRPEPDVFDWTNVVDWVAGSMYWIDIVANFMTGFVVRHHFNLKRKLVMEPHLIALYYVRHGTFLPDLIAALPFIVESVLVAIPDTTNGFALHIVLLARLLRFTRVLRLMKALVFSSMTSHYNPHLVKYVNIGMLFILNLAYAGAILINFVGCLWFYIATLQGLDNSWVNGELSSFSAVSSQE